MQKQKRTLLGKGQTGVLRITTLLLEASLMFKPVAEAGAAIVNMDSDYPSKGCTPSDRGQQEGHVSKCARGERIDAIFLTSAGVVEFVAALLRGAPAPPARAGCRRDAGATLHGHLISEDEMVGAVGFEPTTSTV